MQRKCEGNQSMLMQKKKNQRETKEVSSSEKKGQTKNTETK